MKFITIVGARPQFIKASVISRKIKKFNSLKEIMIHTGQHFDKNMSNIFFRELKIPKPKYNLNINNLPYPLMISKMVTSIIEILILEKPNAVIVYGDTNSTLAGGIAAAGLKIPIVHIESGLRSFNRSMPEEINRTITDHFSELLFCPNENAKKNLINEGIQAKAFITGDIMLDSFKYFEKKIKNENNLKSKKYILATIHREENTSDSKKLTEIFFSLDELNSIVPVILPLHPRTSNLLKKFNIKSNISFIEPLGYIDFLKCLINSYFVITDSGGLQKEAFFAQKKCITLRNETEWTELLDIGVNMLSSPIDLVKNFKTLSQRKVDFDKNIYGNGEAGERILTKIVNHFES